MCTFETGFQLFFNAMTAMASNITYNLIQWLHYIRLLRFAIYSELDDELWNKSFNDQSRRAQHLQNIEFIVTSNVFIFHHNFNSFGSSVKLMKNFVVFLVFTKLPLTLSISCSHCLVNHTNNFAHKLNEYTCIHVSKHIQILVLNYISYWWRYLQIICNAVYSFFQLCVEYN